VFTVLVLLALCAPLGALPSASASETSVSAFVVQAGAREPVQLDPMSLVDGAGSIFEEWIADGTDAGSFPEIAVSTNGTTAVILRASETSGQRYAAVYDGVGGPLRLTIDLDRDLWIAYLGADGHHLILAEGLGCGPTGCGARTWHTYDTRSGELVGSTTAPDPLNGWPLMFAPDGTKAYEPVYALDPGKTVYSQPGPWPLSIVAYDLIAGTELTRVEVPGVVGGNWPGDTDGGGYLGYFENPAIALSPDGATIAVIDTAMESLTIVDTLDMSVQRVTPIHEPTSWLTDALTWLGVAPRSAQAKVSEGQSREAHWSADGRSLFVTGYETRLTDDPAGMTGSGYGLTRIDAMTGAILASQWDGQIIEGPLMIVAPDGLSLYVVMTTRPWWEATADAQPEYILYRLDPESFSVLAERPLDDWPVVRLIHVRA
jgi:hypothetical protein